MATPVPIFKLEFEQDIVDEFREKSVDVLTSGRPLSESRYCREFESAFKDLVEYKIIHKNCSLDENLAFGGMPIVVLIFARGVERWTRIDNHGNHKNHRTTKESNFTMQSKAILENSVF